MLCPKVGGGGTRAPLPPSPTPLLRDDYKRIERSGVLSKTV